MNYDILCAGLATFDTLMSPVSVDLMSSDGAMAESVITGSGGDAVNTAISLAKLGTSVCIAACVGDDPFADIIEADLKCAGVRTDGLWRDRTLSTNSPVVLIDPDGNRHIIRTAKGGNRSFSRYHIPDTLLTRAKHIHIASINMLPELDGFPLAGLFETAHKLGITTSMDSSYDKEGLWMERIKDVLTNCDIFIPSMQEASNYAGSSDLDEITNCFSHYSLKYFGVKLGKSGVYVTDFREKHYLPSFYQHKPIDTTGAGDAFFAGFLAAYTRGLDLRSCAVLGSAQSASVLRSAGANRSSGNFSEAEQCIKENGYFLSVKGEA